MTIRPTIATVDLAAIVANLHTARRQAPGAAVCAVVKADAYGHGLVPVARALADAGADWLGVALIEEGLALRAAGLTTPILVLAGALDGGMEALVQARLTPSLSSPGQLEELARAARGKPVAAHLEVDTGMTRLGLPMAELAAFLTRLASTPHVLLEGVLTHLASSEVATDPYTPMQLDRFAEVQRLLAAHGQRPRWLHVANSGGVRLWPAAHRSLVRPGIMLYGIDPGGATAVPELAPALRWTTAPVYLRRVAAGTAVSYGCRWHAPRDSLLATLPVGYADGYTRRLGDRAEVLVRGRRARVVGTICMDLCMIDVTDVPGVAIGDEVVLLGSQGGETIAANELGERSGTIGYEIVCGIGARVPRRYIGAAGGDDR